MGHDAVARRTCGDDTLHVGLRCDLQSARVYNLLMRVILTGVTGMVGEGVLLECLENDSVEKVLAVSRRPTTHTHPKLEQLIVPISGRRTTSRRS